MTESTAPAEAGVRCFLYHATHEPRIFETQAEIEAALAEGWADSPGAAESRKLAKDEAAPEAPKPAKVQLKSRAKEPANAGT